MIRNNIDFRHTSVLLKETVDGLGVKPGEKYIDATLGGGGHTQEIIKRGGIVLGIDVDDGAIDYVSSNLEIGTNLFLVRGNFTDLKEIAEKYKFSQCAGIVFDLGMSTFQIENSGRGFSFLRDEPLDMRMDNRQELTARDWINKTTKEEIYEVLTKYSEEIDSRDVIQAIIRARSLKPIETTGQLARIVIEAKKTKEKIHPATRIFQALRIIVNSETANLEKGLDGAYDVLKKDGRLVVISFHSLEDRIVKLYLKKKKLKPINKKPIRASYEESRKNPKSRGAKLRIFEKIE